jgi:hypothetical protein
MTDKEIQNKGYSISLNPTEIHRPHSLGNAFFLSTRKNYTFFRNEKSVRKKFENLILYIFSNDTSIRPLSQKN